MKKCFFIFLFLFFSACSSDLKSDKSDKSSKPVYPFSFSIQKVNKYPNQEKGSNLVKDQPVKTNTDASVKVDMGTEVDASANVEVNAIASVGTDTDVIVNAGIDTSTTVEAGANADVDIENLRDKLADASADVEAGPGTDVGVKALKEFSVATVRQGEISADTGSDSVAEVGADTDADTGSDFITSANLIVGSSLITGVSTSGSSGSIREVITGADTDVETDIVQKTADRAIQELAGFNRGGHLVQEEVCEGFSKTDWVNQGLSIEQSVQHFARQQMQNLLSINREFPSPKDKENSVRCFVNTAFSVNNIFKITTNNWRQGIQQVSFQAPHRETLVEFVEHYFVAWVGYGLLSPVKSIPSDRINFVVEEPRLLKNKRYAVVTTFNIMNFRSVDITWIIDAQSFPNELSFLDISLEGVSTLYLLKQQMQYLFQKKDGDMKEVIFVLQNKMDDSSFAYL